MTESEGKKISEGKLKPELPPSGYGKRSIVAAVLAVLIAVLFARHGDVSEFWKYQQLPSELRPSKLPTLKGLEQFQGEHARNYRWGTYRPGLYFGT